MKCLICSNTIDDKKDFTVKGPQGQDLDDVVGRLRHFEELGKWTHVTLTAQRSYTLVLLSGHVCPAHKPVPGGIGLVDAVVPAQASVAAPAATPSPARQAPAAPIAAAAPQNPATPTVRRKEPQS
jgi:hypothetical protein